MTEVKRVPCLKCQEPFDSQWAGDRVCPRCERGKTWREGARTATFSINPQARMKKAQQA